MIYLASPYSHPSLEIRQMRFRAACVAAGELFKQGQLVISPIAHTHPIKMLTGLGGEWEQWQEFDTQLIRCCDRLVVLQIDGWITSVGVDTEIKIAEALRKPVDYLLPRKVGLNYAYPYVRTLGEQCNPI